ncbi:MAG TPA: alpha-L-fucosidase, partial [Gemmatimonadales bacterium]|nr:alpha-L-fucosidase [Gemmatimonadales bacterium]
RPGEADVSIRPGWFWHPEEDAKVKPAAELLDLYHQSVGRNAGLLLNVPPTTSGRFHENDVHQLNEFGRLVRDEFVKNEARAASASASTEQRNHRAAHVLDDDREMFWMPASGTTGSLELTFGRAVPVRVIDLREAIQFGQHIARHRVELRVNGRWQVAVRGTTIGNRWLHRIAPVVADGVRLVIEESHDAPRVAQVGVFPSSP